MSDQIIDQIESIATTFDKPAENVIFMKELLAKTKPLKPGIEFDNFHVAMSKNGGLVAFVKKSSYFIMDSSNPMKDSARILCQDLSNEHRIRLRDDKDKQIVLFDFTDDEQLYAIFNEGTIYKFDICTSRFIEKTTGPTFKADNIVKAKYFEKGFVALTNSGDFYIIKSMKELTPINFFPMGSLINIDVVPDFIFLPPNKTKSGQLELLFPNTLGHGIIRVVEQSENKFGKDSLGKVNGVYFIQKDHCEDYICGKSGLDAAAASDLGKITALAISPSKNQIALYREEMNTVFFFHSTLDANPDKYQRKFAIYQINDKDDAKDQAEQKTVLNDATIGQFLFCGEDAICLSGKRFVFVINVNNKTIVYKITNKSAVAATTVNRFCYCISEVDGLRLLTNDGVYLICKVSQELYDACFPFSDESSKKLISAYKSANDREANCDKEIRDIASDLPTAVESLQKASTYLWKKDVQLSMLRAAQHGKNFVQKEDYNFNNFVQTCKDIRIVNNLRESDKPRLITFNEYIKLDPKELINRLLRTQDFYLAFEISKYLDLNVKKVYQKFAIAIMKSLPNGLTTTEELDQYANIQKKLNGIPNISYIKLAKKAFKYQRNEMGIKFLENEKSILTKIPQYIELRKWDKALELAFETYDSNVLLTVLDKIIKVESVKDFCTIVGKYKRADSAVIEYLKKNLPSELETYLLEKRNYVELFYLAVENFFKCKTLEDRKNYTLKAKDYIKKIENDKDRDPSFDYKFYEGYINDLEKSVMFKTELLQEDIIKQTDISPFDNSIYDVYKIAIKEKKAGLVDTKNYKIFKMSDRKLAILRIKTYAEMNQIEPIIQLLSDMKKSNLTYLNFAELFIEIKDKNRAADVIKKITDPDYFDYKVEMLKYIEKYSDALEVIISDKNCENKAMLVNDILNKSPDLRKKVDELIAQYGPL